MFIPEYQTLYLFSNDVRYFFVYCLLDISLSICELRLKLADNPINGVDFVIFVHFNLLPKISTPHPLVLDFFEWRLNFHELR